MSIKHLPTPALMQNLPGICQTRRVYADRTILVNGHRIYVPCCVPGEIVSVLTDACKRASQTDRLPAEVK